MFLNASRWALFGFWEPLSSSLLLKEPELAMRALGTGFMWAARLACTCIGFIAAQIYAEIEMLFQLRLLAKLGLRHASAAALLGDRHNKWPGGEKVIY